MGRTHMEMLANFLVLLYLITHGVSVPPEGQADLVSGFYHSIRAWLSEEARRLSTLVSLAARRPLQT